LNDWRLAIFTLASSSGFERVTWPRHEPLGQYLGRPSRPRGVAATSARIAAERSSAIDAEARELASIVDEHAVAWFRSEVFPLPFLTAANKDEQGRAQNRRVELVEQ
jgi:hypothetical protein